MSDTDAQRPRAARPRSRLAGEASSDRTLAVGRPSTGLRAGLTPHQRVLDAYFSQRSPRTVQAYRECLMFFAGWASGEGLLPGVDLDDEVDAVLAKLTAVLFSWDSPTAHAHGIAYVQWMVEKGLAPNTVNQRLSALRAFARLGRQLGLVPWSLDVRGVKPGLVRDVRGPSMEQVQVLLAHAAKTSTRMHAMLLLMFERGLRSIEIRELKVAHLKLDTTPPSILVRGKGKAGLTPLTVSTTVATALQRWHSVRVLYDTEASNPDSFVFFRQGHPLRPVSKAAIWKVVSEVGADCGIKLWPHALRHSAITEALEATNGDIRRVQQFSRHSNVQTVMKYDDARRDAGGEVSELLSQRGAKR